MYNVLNFKQVYHLNLESIGNLQKIPFFLRKSYVKGMKAVIGIDYAKLIIGNN
jgi:hypothetical protein